MFVCLYVDNFLQEKLAARIMHFGVVPMLSLYEGNESDKTNGYTLDILILFINYYFLNKNKIDKYILLFPREMTVCNLVITLAARYCKYQTCSQCKTALLLHPLATHIVPSFFVLNPSFDDIKSFSHRPHLSKLLQAFMKILEDGKEQGHSLCHTMSHITK